MSTKAKSKPQIFVDTSVQIARILGATAKRQTIELTLEQDVHACTAAYVYMEYQRTLKD